MRMSSPQSNLFKTIAVFFISLLIFSMITAAYIHNRIQLEYTKMEQLVTLKSQKVQNIISDYLYKTKTLAALVIKNDGQIEDFDRVASNLVDSEVIRNVILAPEGIVTHVYPIDGNEAILGKNLLTELGGSSEAMEAMRQKQLILGGPFELVQGNHALAGRLPIYLSGDGTDWFWGIVSVTLNYPTVLRDADLDDLQLQNMAFEIYRINPETNEHQIIANSTYPYDKHTSSIERPISIGNVTWYFVLSPVRAWYQYPETWILALVGTIFSLLFSYIYQYSLRLKAIKEELEQAATTDSLTNLQNRRGLLSAMQSAMLNPHISFTLIYMDIDHFKQVNDTYGHDSGNDVLIAFANAIIHNLPCGCLAARIGGDEFVVIYHGTKDMEKIHEFAAAIKQELVSSCSGKYEDYCFDFSYGAASFPADGNTIDQLLSVADSSMYADKSKKTVRSR